jgi:ubiquinone/menaquinone biosynthesis C-methylase UbiE
MKSANATSYRARTQYDEKQSLKYQQRKPGKHRAEMRLIDRAFAMIPKTHRVLDVPCGGGRVAIHLARQGYEVSAADLSDSMIEITRENFAKEGLYCPVEKQDVERITLPDRSFDAIVSFRLFHHFPSTEIRQRVISELCRVAARFVMLSYFSPRSVTSLKRKITGCESHRYAMPLAEVAGYFEACGFRLVKDFAQLPVVHTLHLAVFERVKDRG